MLLHTPFTSEISASLIFALSYAAWATKPSSVARVHCLWTAVWLYAKARVGESKLKPALVVSPYRSIGHRAARVRSGPSERQFIRDWPSWQGRINYHVSYCTSRRLSCQYRNPLLQSLDNILFHVSGFHNPQPADRLRTSPACATFPRELDAGRRKRASSFQHSESFTPAPACDIQHLTLTRAANAPPEPSQSSVNAARWLVESRNIDCDRVCCAARQ